METFFGLIEDLDEATEAMLGVVEPGEEYEEAELPVLVTSAQVERCIMRPKTRQEAYPPAYSYVRMARKRKWMPPVVVLCVKPKVEPLPAPRGKAAIGFIQAIAEEARRRVAGGKPRPWVTRGYNHRPGASI